MEEETIVAYGVPALVMLGVLMLGVGGGFYGSIGVVADGCQPAVVGEQPQCVEQLDTLNQYAMYGLGIGVFSIAWGGGIGVYLQRSTA